MWKQEKMILYECETKKHTIISLFFCFLFFNLTFCMPAIPFQAFVVSQSWWIHLSFSQFSHQLLPWKMKGENIFASERKRHTQKETLTLTDIRNKWDRQSQGQTQNHTHTHMCVCARVCARMHTQTHTLLCLYNIHKHTAGSGTIKNFILEKNFLRERNEREMYGTFTLF